MTFEPRSGGAAGGLDYAQARIHARHALLTDEAAWERVNTTRGLGPQIQVVRDTALSRWVQRMDAGSDVHRIERVLRRELDEYIVEVSSWLPERWQRAMLHTRRLVHLPWVATLLSPERIPQLSSDDSTLASLAQLDLASRVQALREGGWVPLGDGGSEPDAVLPTWLSAWRALWPRNRPRDLTGMEALVEHSLGHLQQMGSSGDPGQGCSLRRRFQSELHGQFRRHAEEPAAAFCHVLLTALELERLRGALVRCALFPDLKGAR